MSRLIGYARVSTTGQSLEIQLDKLKEAGCDPIFEEKISGRTEDRPEYQKMMEFIEEGDTIVVASQDRISRDMTDIMVLLRYLRGRGVEFKSLEDGEATMDRSTPIGKLVHAMLGVVAEFEVDTTRNRQMEGIGKAVEEDRARKARGEEPLKYKGSVKKAYPPKFKEFILKAYPKIGLDVDKEGNSIEITAEYAMRELGLTKTTFYRMMNDIMDENAKPLTDDHKELQKYRSHDSFKKFKFYIDPNQLNEKTIEREQEEREREQEKKDKEKIEQENRELKEQLKALQNKQQISQIPQSIEIPTHSELQSPPITQAQSSYVPQLPPGMPAMGKAPTMTNNESGVKGF